MRRTGEPHSGAVLSLARREVWPASAVPSAWPMAPVCLSSTKHDPVWAPPLACNQLGCLPPPRFLLLALRAPSVSSPSSLSHVCSVARRRVTACTAWPAARRGAGVRPPAQPSRSAAHHWPISLRFLVHRWSRALSASPCRHSRGKRQHPSAGRAGRAARQCLSSSSRGRRLTNMLCNNAAAPGWPSWLQLLPGCCMLQLKWPAAAATVLQLSTALCDLQALRHVCCAAPAPWELQSCRRGWPPNPRWPASQPGRHPTQSSSQACMATETQAADGFVVK